MLLNSLNITLLPHLSLRFDKSIGITHRENGHILISEAYPFSENGRILTDLGLGNRYFHFLGLGNRENLHILPT